MKPGTADLGAAFSCQMRREERGMKLGRIGLALAIAGVLVGGVLFGSVVTGQAAPTQQVTASLSCEPATVTTGSTVGCLLIVTNNGVNTVNSVVVNIAASDGTFLLSDSDSCESNDDGNVLICNIGQLAGGAIFAETHELQMPSTGSVVQTASGRYSPNPNKRGSDTIAPVTETTMQDSSIDFDARFANGNVDAVQTDTTISGGNPYTTGAELFGESFTVGLSVRERDAAANDDNCPTTGCFGDQVIDFDITSLSGTDSDLPEGYTLVITIADEAIPNSVKEDELDVTHTTDLGTELVPLCPDTDSAGACIVDRDIVPSTKIATIVITGPGDGNGSWGVG
ncbi:MAG: hypothetical protein ACRDQT_00060 [Gaiellaceae bacterium]